MRLSRPDGAQNVVLDVVQRQRVSGHARVDVAPWARGGNQAFVDVLDRLDGILVHDDPQRHGVVEVDPVRHLHVLRVLPRIQSLQVVDVAGQAGPVGGVRPQLRVVDEGDAGRVVGDQVGVEQRLPLAVVEPRGIRRVMLVPRDVGGRPGARNPAERHETEQPPRGDPSRNSFHFPASCGRVEPAARHCRQRSRAIIERDAGAGAGHSPDRASHLRPAETAPQGVDGHFDDPQTVLDGLDLHLHGPAVRAIPHVEAAQRLGADGAVGTEVGHRRPPQQTYEQRGHPVSRDLRSGQGARLPPAQRARPDGQVGPAGDRFEQPESLRSLERPVAIREQHDVDGVQVREGGQAGQARSPACPAGRSAPRRLAPGRRSRPSTRCRRRRNRRPRAGHPSSRSASRSATTSPIFRSSSLAGTTTPTVIPAYMPPRPSPARYGFRSRPGRGTETGHRTASARGASRRARLRTAARTSRSRPDTGSVRTP